jgi:hypothetical protein
MDELVSQGKFYGMNPSDSLARAKELAKTLDLTSLEKRKVSTCPVVSAADSTSHWA